MKIAVIAADGRTGRQFVRLALAEGHIVNAGVHSGTLEPHPNLTIMPCDATNPDEVAQLLAGCEAVASFIGHIDRSPDLVQTNAAYVVTDVMKKLNILRIVSLTGTGVRMPGDRILLLDRFITMGLSIADPARLKDGRDHVKVLQDSGLDWTILRVMKLENTPPRPFTLTPNGPPKLYVSRIDAARAAIEVLRDNSFVHQAPILSRY